MEPLIRTTFKNISIGQRFADMFFLRIFTVTGTNAFYILLSQQSGLDFFVTPHIVSKVPKRNGLNGLFRRGSQSVQVVNK